MLNMLMAGGLGGRARPLQVRLGSYVPVQRKESCLPSPALPPSSLQGHLKLWVDKGELGLDGEAPHKVFIYRHGRPVLETRKGTARDPSEAEETEGKYP